MFELTNEVGKPRKETEVSSVTITVGEHLFDVSGNLAETTDYGVRMDAVLGGEVALPPGGARFDVSFEGALQGSKLKGTYAGVDYLKVRADGLPQLHIHGTIATEDGERIAVFAEGVAIFQEGSSVAQLRENMKLTTSSASYAWVNQLPVWVQGTVDVASGELNLKGYAA
jgi:hypothetical protein